MAANVLNREFTAKKRNQKWVADITYIATLEGWLYLAVSRELPDAGLVAHSDRGVQYASEHSQGVLQLHGLECSMSRKGDCWDNAPRESFFATLKKELVHHETYATRAEARASLFEYIEVFYNRERQHSALGYVSPLDFEQEAA